MLRDAVVHVCGVSSEEGVGGVATGRDGVVVAGVEAEEAGGVSSGEVEDFDIALARACSHT